VAIEHNSIVLPSFLALITQVQPINGNSYPAKLSSLIEGEIKTFYNQEKLKEFATIKPALQKIINRLLHVEEEMRVRRGDSRKNKPL
jgi:predicted house-cleaning noncanonical NTP pyrophosphatase (MazG superfamily)